MTHAQDEITQTIARLGQLAADPTQPAKVRARARGLVDHLETPTRVGIFGLPNSGKREVLRSLLAPEQLPDALPALTTEFVPGAHVACTAMLSDGSKFNAQGYPERSLTAQGAIFVSVETPACAKTARSYLVVHCDEDAADLRAALQWAADRVDIAIWCSSQWSSTEAQVWTAAPEELKNHAILHLRGMQMPQNAPPDGFQKVLDATNGADTLIKLLSDIIADARSQDATVMAHFLSKYGAEPIPDSAAPAQPPLLPDARTVQVPEEARIELSRLFNQVRSAALALEKTSAASAEPTAVLETFEALFEDLSDQVTDLNAASDAWPDLEPTLEEARDVALLLRIEGGAEQATDAARLLLQLRYDMETKLAA